MSTTVATINERIDRLTLNHGLGLFGGRTVDDRLEDLFLSLHRKLRMFDRKKLNDEEAPNDFSRKMAIDVLSRLREFDLPPSDIVTSAEGGIAFCFEQSDRYADIEVLNSGEVVAVTSNRKDQPTVWTVSQSPLGISKTLVRIREYFRGA